MLILFKEDYFGMFVHAAGPSCGRRSTRDPADAARRRIVLFAFCSDGFGGRDWSETWEWDGVAWEEQTIGNRMHSLGAPPYYYGMHLGEEGPHEELPGLVGPIFSECNARHYYARWRDELARPAGRL